MEEIVFDSLIKNKVITHNELIQSVIDKQKSMPSVLELVFKERLLPEEKICDILLEQEKNGGTFTHSCKSLGLWTEELEDDLRALLDFSSKTLFEVLAKKSAGSLFKILEAYEYQLDSIKDNFDSNYSLNKAAAASKTPLPQNEEKKPEAQNNGTGMSLDEFLSKISADPSTETTPKFGNVNKELLPDYTELLNSDKKSEIEAHILKMESLSGDPQAENLRSLYRDLHSFKGAARFVQANMSETMIHNMEDLLSTIQRY